MAEYRIDSTWSDTPRRFGLLPSAASSDSERTRTAHDVVSLPLTLVMLSSLRQNARYGVEVEAYRLAAAASITLGLASGDGGGGGRALSTKPRPLHGAHGPTGSRKRRISPKPAHWQQRTWYGPEARSSQ